MNSAPSAAQEIVLTRFDHDRLSALIDRLRRSGSEKSESDVDALEEELERAVVVDPNSVPATVVTMNSEVVMTSLDTGQTVLLTVVFPAQANPRAGRVSVLAPLGLALLGARVGDDIIWTVPAGPRRLRVDQIRFQPEAEGIFSL